MVDTTAEAAPSPIPSRSSAFVSPSPAPLGSAATRTPSFPGSAAKPQPSSSREPSAAQLEMAGLEGEAQRLVALLGARRALQAQRDGPWAEMLASITPEEEAQCQADAVMYGTTAHDVRFEGSAPPEGDARVQWRTGGGTVTYCGADYRGVAGGGEGEVGEEGEEGEGVGEGEGEGDGEGEGEG